MRKVLIVFGILAAALAGGQALAANYKFDIEGQHAFVNFKVSHLGYSYIVGRFNRFDGSFSHDPKDPSASRVSVEIDAASLDTNHAERDKHLRSPDFFDVRRHPRITFESTGYEGSAEAGTLRGQLSFLGVTREIEIDLRKVGEGKDPWGGYRSGFVGATRLVAADYGLPEWLGEVDIELNIEGVRTGGSS